MAIPPPGGFEGYRNPGVMGTGAIGDEKNPGGTGTSKVINAAASPWIGADAKTSTQSGLGLNGYQWNLPPHKWSLPVEPSLDDMVIDPATRAIGATHKYRRGRIYWYARVDNTYVNSNNYNYGGKDDPRYGFQFMWNPTEFNTSVAVNMSVTPTFADKFATVVGAFPSGQALSLQIALDRTNDFACLNSLNLNASDLQSISSLNNPTAFNAKDTKSISEAARTFASSTFASTLGYTPGHSFDQGFAETLINKVLNLARYGTTADIEYIYKAINGPGWTNVATGRESSEIGFLRPTLLRIDLGPLSYLGYVSAMNVSHTKFTKGMIPMASTIDLQFNLMATAGLSSQ